MAPKRRCRKPLLEVLSRTDGAWYDGDISLEGRTLRVHFDGFGNDVDEFWDMECLRNRTKVREIVRLRSRQLQDSQCTEVEAGTIVCANFRTQDNKESKYYDAKVIWVQHYLHSYEKNGKQEICNCVFKVLWETGPFKSNEAYLGCADISFIETEGEESHPVIAQVLEAIFIDTQNIGGNIDGERNLQEIFYFERVMRKSQPTEEIEDTQISSLGLEDHSQSQEMEETAEGFSLTREGEFVCYFNIKSNDMSSSIEQKIMNCKNFHKFLEKQASILRDALDAFESKNYWIRL